MKESKTREELLDSTIKFYNSTNRAMQNTGGCYYHLQLAGEDKPRRCAIGREISEELAITLDLNNDGAVSDDDVFDKLPSRLQDMGQMFLQDVQLLHDDEKYWDENGLSEEGEQEVERLIKQYNLNYELQN